MKSRVAGAAFDGIWGDFGRRIGRVGCAEGLRSASVRPARPATVWIGVVVAASSARVVTVVVVDVGEGR
jgi:hypothetical protein